MARLTKIEKSIEEKDIKYVLNSVTDDFLGNDLLRDKKSLKSLLIFHFFRNRKIEIKYKILTIVRHSKESATCKLVAYLSGDSQKDVYAADFTFRNEDGHWLVQRLVYRAITQNLLNPFGLKDEKTKAKKE